MIVGGQINEICIQVQNWVASHRDVKGALVPYCHSSFGQLVSTLISVMVLPCGSGPLVQFLEVEVERVCKRVAKV